MIVYILQFWLMMLLSFENNPEVLFSVCRIFNDLACKKISVIHIYKVKLVLHYLLCFS